MFSRARARSSSDEVTRRARPPAQSLFASYFQTIAIAAALPLLIGGAIEGFASFRDRERSDAEIRRLEATQAANEIELFFKQLTTLVADIGQQSFSDDRGAALKERATEYRRLFSLYKPIIKVIWIDDADREVIRLDRREVDELDGKDATQFAALAALARAAEGLQFQSEEQGGARQNKLLVAVKTRGVVAGVLVLQVDLRFVNELLAKMQFNNGGYVFITDKFGAIVSHPVANLALRKVMFADATRMSGIALAPTDVPLAGVSDTRIAFSGYRLQSPAWIVIAAQPERLATAWIRDFLLRLAVLLVATMAGAALFAWWSARRMSKPISELAQGAQSLMSGNTVQLITPSRHVELQQLASQFSTMAARVTEAQSGLERKVEEKTRDLANANLQLNIASKHKSDFLAHMSHELRTPLNAVIGFSEMLKAQYFGPLNEKQAEYVKDINDSGQHLLALINEILDLAKVEAGRMEVVRSNAHVPIIVEACCTLVSERFQRKRQVLDAEVSPSVSFWFLDERKFKQCLLNLLSNANKFTPEGGRVGLRVFVEDVRAPLPLGGGGVGGEGDGGIGINAGASNDHPPLPNPLPRGERGLRIASTQVEGGLPKPLAPGERGLSGSLVVQVTDTGVGIAADALPKLFSEFYQVAATMAGPVSQAGGEGTGLGLALTKKFVELHGGMVEVTSVIGEGSVFTLRFPAQDVGDSA